ncbi:trehalose-phosphatase [Sphingomonas sp. 1P06PA]|uniref:trehalose-phosphatase n=1 Tax=Sphingomonas sp. 1P06PA TaxID=554121 RepID=UPI0039A6F871
MPSTSAASVPLPRPPGLLSAGASLLLDFDGTLVDLADRPDAVAFDPPLIALLGRLTGTFGGRIALVSGRSVAQLEHFLGGALGGIALVGSHGAEMRIGDRHLSPDRPASLAQAERIVRAQIGDRAGVVIEAKSLGIAIHYRMAPALEGEARALAERIATDTGLVVQDGKMMIELHAAGHDKGAGIAGLMRQPGFAGTKPIFLGDDLTDEAGFAVVATLGGMPVLVGPPRPTAARYRLADVAAVRAWLGYAA